MRTSLGLAVILLSCFSSTWAEGGDTAPMRISGKLLLEKDEYFLSRLYVNEGGLAPEVASQLKRDGKIKIEPAPQGYFGVLSQNTASVGAARALAGSARAFIPIKKSRQAATTSPEKSVNSLLSECAFEPYAETSLWGKLEKDAGGFIFRILGLFCYDLAGKTLHP